MKARIIKAIMGTGGTLPLLMMIVILGHKWL
jgi:hypothetical protein